MVTLDCCCWLRQSLVFCWYCLLFLFLSGQFIVSLHYRQFLSFYALLLVYRHCYSLLILGDPGNHNKKTQTFKIKKLQTFHTVSYTHLRAHETRGNLVCRLLLEKKKQKKRILYFIFLILKSWINIICRSTYVLRICFNIRNNLQLKFLPSHTHSPGFNVKECTLCDPQFEVANTNQTSCYRLREIRITLTKDGYIGLLLLASSITGVLLVLFVILVFIRSVYC